MAWAVAVEVPRGQSLLKGGDGRRGRPQVATGRRITHGQRDKLAVRMAGGRHFYPAQQVSNGVDAVAGPSRGLCPPHCDKKEYQIFLSYIGKFGVEQLQSHV